MKNKRSRRLSGGLKAAFSNRSFVIGFVITAIVVVVALFPQVFATHDPNALSPTEVLAGPSSAHFFGTDNYGRDVFSRCIWATRMDLQIGLISASIPLVVGSIIGLLAGFYGGIVDTLFMRLLDVVMAFPFTVLVIAIMAILGQGIQNMYIAIWIIGWVAFAKLVRAEVLVVKNSEYVMAARIMGFSDRRILLRHILPNTISSAIVYFTSYIVICMLTGASLSFLGLGVQPPTSEWGSLMNMGRGYINNAPWMTIFPGLFLAITGVGLSLIGDGMTDFLRTKGR
ncbi:ABC transporter permease [Lawsonibacter celer]|uniref:ABC transporter permease n=1 Tax=Lawsonibacter celer TaxID=2986526 RepID=UPI00164486AC|nr:ABC transporter permease [Lawsonibacter celer]